MRLKLDCWGMADHSGSPCTGWHVVVSCHRIACSGCRIPTFNTHQSTFQPFQEPPSTVNTLDLLMVGHVGKTLIRLHFRQPVALGIESEERLSQLLCFAVEGFGASVLSFRSSFYTLYLLGYRIPVRLRPSRLPQLPRHDSAPRIATIKARHADHYRGQGRAL
jgi:hypothetical protein